MYSLADNQRELQKSRWREATLDLLVTAKAPQVSPGETRTATTQNQETF